MTPGLFDAVSARDSAISQVEANARAEWMAHAALAISVVASRGEPFTSEEVWAYMESLRIPAPREPRAMGAAFMAAARAGTVKATGEYRQGTRVQSHARPVAVWIRT